MSHEKVKKVAEYIAQKAQDFPLDYTPCINWQVHIVKKNDEIELQGGFISIGYVELQEDLSESTPIFVGKCLISPLKGCNGVAVMSNLKIDTEHRNKGLGTFIVELANIVCNKISYNYCICTTKEENMAMRSVLAKNQYKELFEFNNLKTDNDIVFCAKSLSEYQNLVIENKAKRSVLVSIDTFEIK
jgi:hypothetical protein